MTALPNLSVLHDNNAQPPTCVIKQTASASALCEYACMLALQMLQACL